MRQTKAKKSTIVLSIWKPINKKFQRIFALFHSNTELKIFHIDINKGFISRLNRNKGRPDDEFIGIRQCVGCIRVGFTGNI